MGPAAVTLALGVVASLVVFFALGRAEDDRLRLDVERSAHSLQTFATNPIVAAGVLQTLSRLAAFAEAIDTTSEVTAELVASFRWDFPWLGPPDLDVDFEYVPRVPPAGRAAFEAAPTGQPAATPRTIMDATTRRPLGAPAHGEYFPLAYRSRSVREGAPLGTDVSTRELQWEAMEIARDRGTVTSFASVPVDVEAGHFMLVRSFYPIYEGGGIPDGVAERRRLLRGFATSVSYSELDDLGLLVPVSIRGIEALYYSGPDRVPTDSLAPHLAREVDRGRMATTWYTYQGVSQYVMARATPELAAARRSPIRWLVLLLGFVGTGWIATVTQATLRRADEERRNRDAAALKESEERYRLLAENASDVIYTHDLDFVCTYISPSIVQQRGFTVDEMVGANFLDRLTPESRSYVRRLIGQALLQAERSPAVQRHHTSQIDALCKDGSVIAIENRTTLLVDDDGNPVGVLGVSRDISDRKQVEEEKEELENRYRHAQKMEAIGTLAGGVAHDFNNLLTGILGYSELLKLEYPPGSEAQHHIGVIEKAAGRAQELTSRLLGFARKGKFQTMPVDLNEAVEDVIKLLERTIDKRIEIEWKPYADRAVVMGDPSQIHQVLLNLAVNARDAMPEGGKLTFACGVEEFDEIACRSVVGLTPGVYNILSVRDTGKGISKEMMERIFEPYFTDKEPGRGTGMGLAMVYGVTRSHGGTVTVESKEGLGALFRVFLPHTAGQRGLFDGRAPELVTGTGRVLVVDDEDFVRKICSDMLKQLGYEVAVAADGLEALEYFRAHWREIDLVIMDIVMPRMGGHQCLAHLRDIDPNVRAILSSGYSAEEVKLNVDESDAVGFLQKPYRLRDLSEAVAKALATVDTPA